MDYSLQFKDVGVSAGSSIWREIHERSPGGCILPQWSMRYLLLVDLCMNDILQRGMTASIAKLHIYIHLEQVGPFENRGNRVSDNGFFVYINCSEHAVRASRPCNCVTSLLVLRLWNLDIERLQSPRIWKFMGSNYHPWNTIAHFPTDTIRLLFVSG